MNRTECKRKIAKKLLEIKEIYNEYNPEGVYLSLTITENGYFINNSYWKNGADENNPIDIVELWNKEDNEDED